MTLAEHIKNALTQRDLEIYREVGEEWQYEELADAAVAAFESYVPAPRTKSHFVEGLVFL